MTENSLTDSKTSRDDQQTTPHRRLTHNDERSAGSATSSSAARARRHNGDYGMGASVSLPPSTAGTTGIDINRVEYRFYVIAISINQLGMSHM